MQWKHSDHPSKEIQQGAIRREDDGFNFWDSQGKIIIDYLQQVVPGTVRNMQTNRDVCVKNRA
jgi:hypothetical protein